LTIIGLLLGSPTFAEGPHSHVHPHDLSGFEAGTSVGYVKLEEDETAFGLHLHLMKRVSGDGLGQHIAVGLAGELILGDHVHSTAMVALAVHPWRGLGLMVAPGVQWAKHDEAWESEYATHVEAIYTVEVGRFDMGPAIGYSTTRDDDHLTIGFHFGLHL